VRPPDSASSLDGVLGAYFECHKLDRRAGRELPREGAVEGMLSVEDETLEVDDTESSAHIDISFARQPIGLPRERERMPMAFQDGSPKLN
jgi:hypothetical protein